jgi:arsenate reductase-like glutaredoxin family protein
VLANKTKFQRDEALLLARQSSEALVAKGRKLLRFDLSEATDDELASAILGRSGTLRAPAIRSGATFLVGFNADAYTEVFG